jgi:hypothetical protein
MVFGCLQHTMDSGMKLASLHYFWGGTWSPNCWSDFNTLKYLFFSHLSAFAVAWTPIPFEVARVRIFNLNLFYYFFNRKLILLIKLGQRI